MDSSDSGEDFESADEDLDLNEPQKCENNTNQKISESSSKEKHILESSKTQHDETVTDNLHCLQKLNLEDNNKSNHECLEPLTHIDNTNSQTQKIEEVNSNVHEDKSITLPISTEENLLRNKNVVSSELGEGEGWEVEDIEENVPPSCDGWEISEENKEEIKAENTICVPIEKVPKEGDNRPTPEVNNSQIPKSESSSQDGWEDDGWQDPPSNSDCQEISQQDKAVNKTENTISDPIEKVSNEEDNILKVKNSKVPKSESNNQDGWEDDGWEIEEEDGFEIPAQLGKLSEGSSHQSAQEHRDPFKALQGDEQGWSGWGGWGVGSLLSTATGGVTVLSSHVSAGLSTVLETAVGAPNPEVLAAAVAASTELSDTKNAEECSTAEERAPSGFGGFGSIVSGVSFLGSSVINRGLDTLETLGKKTMEVLQEGDPGLKKKRALLFPNQDKPVLSQILREAKEKADNSDREKEEKETARRVHFESLFDDYQGMVHLEALEMLSTQCDLKLQSLALSQSGDQLEDLQETMAQVRDLCELAEDEDETEALPPNQFAQRVTNLVSGLGVNLTAAKIIKVNEEVVSRLNGLDGEPASVVNEAAISSLAKFTAAAMEYFHKSAELLLAKPLRKTHEEADSYTQLTQQLCARVSAMANEFTQLLTKNHPIANSSTITNIFLEASNSCSYMRNACQLLVPILQVGAVCT